MVATTIQTNSTEQQASLYSNESLLASLSTFQKILLSTNGTITHLLEEYVAETIHVVKLHEHIENCVSRLPATHQIIINSQHTPVLEREILLQGQSTMSHWIYANSSILLNHLPRNFRLDLLSSSLPIGKLWSKYEVINTKKILLFEREKAGALATHFGIHADDELLSRTYTVQTGDILTMVITEKFPCCFFSES